eukprot:GFYU01004536.1.p3 GENE.GFYU01004536.1~~GFYU01004536.1.p3  ORF type:complete len:121 (+),score=25.81 GFYU01004536.1:252-614(+)
MSGSRMGWKCLLVATVLGIMFTCTCAHETHDTVAHTLTETRTLGSGSGSGGDGVADDVDAVAAENVTDSKLAALEEMVTTGHRPSTEGTTSTTKEVTERNGTVGATMNAVDSSGAVIQGT